MEHVEFYKRFPLLVPETLDPLKADGYIETSEAGVSTLQKKISQFYGQMVKECDEQVGWDRVESFDKKTQMMRLKLK
ncbi:hypothetical protein H4S00_004258 [Coemansia sp. D1744]|nr:hypothetical protein H4S00_004258 [Coemansia sp. D1744]